MTVQTLLIGPRGHGGEGVYVAGLTEAPPPDVVYDLSGDFHRSAPGARCILPAEVALNKLIRPRTFPDIGIRALHLRKRYDLVHAHAHPVWLTGLADTPLVMSEGSSSAVYLADYLGWDPPRMAAAFRRSERIYRALRIHDRLLTLDRATRLYVFSDWARQINIRWGADPAKVDVIYPGFDTPPVVDRADRETFTFLFIGTDFERKGGYDVIEAFARVAAELPNARLLIAGSDQARPNPDLLIHSWVSESRREQLLLKLSELECDGKAQRLPWLTRERLRAELFPAADAFVMPTNAEGFGFTNVEAMSFGLPVLTSTAGPADEIVADGETGLLVRRGDVDAIAASMHRLACAPERASAMGVAARQRFEERFTRGRFRRELGDLYRSALEES